MTTAVVLQFTGAFEATDQWWCDYCQRKTAPSYQKCHVVLIYAPQQIIQSAGPELKELIDTVDGCDPARIGVVGARDVCAFDSYADHPSAGRMVFGVPLTGLANGDPSWDIATGFSDLHLDGQSIYRNTNPVREQNDCEVYSFEAELSRGLMVSGDDLSPGPVGIRFGRGINSLPNTTLQKVVDGNFVPGLFRDKVVLIGPQMDPTFGLVTPTTSGSDRMSRLEIRGYIIETFLRGNGVSYAGTVFALCSICIFTLLICQLVRQAPHRHLPTAFLATLVLCVLATAGISYISGFVLPSGAMIFALFASFSVIGFQRYYTLAGASARKRHAIQSGISARNKESRDVWQEVTEATFQVFYPRRMALLELEPSATHLKVARTVHCDEQDIYERRRDIQRSPYFEAIENSAPVRLTSRQFFATNPDVTNVEYVVPLFSGASVLGFMVIELDSRLLESWLGFDNFLGNFAEEMSVLVAGHRQADVKGEGLTGIADRFNEVPEAREQTVIEKQVEVERELQDQIDYAFQSSVSSKAVFDVFGRIIRYNSNLINDVQSVGLVVSGTTCVEMMAAVSARSQHECRKIFRRVVMDRRTEQLFIPADDRTDYCRTMVIAPMRNAGSDTAGYDSRGVLMEIVDGRLFEQVNLWKERITESKCNSAAGRIEDLRQQARQLAGTEAGTDSINELIGSFGQTMNDVLTLLEDFRTLNRCNITGGPEEFLVLDIAGVWADTKIAFGNTLESRAIELMDRLPAQGLPAVANPLLLERMLNTILEILIDNSYDGSKIVVDSVVAGLQCELEFSCQHPDGGQSGDSGLHDEMPGEGKEKMQLLSEEQTDRLNEIQGWLEVWGGSLTIRSKVGSGLQVHLVLQNDAGTEEADLEDPEDQSATGTLLTSASVGNEVADPLAVRDAEWLLNQPRHHYTIQVLSAISAERARDHVERQKNPSQYAIFLKQGKTRLLHVVVFGLFEDRASAKLAASKLADSSVSPWIRMLSSVHSEIEQVDQNQGV
ncbi:MAG: CHASE2 domain-containing protein [Planctomycetota bacterium]